MPIFIANIGLILGLVLHFPFKTLVSRVEERLSLRLIALALAWWVAVALGWVGAPPGIWVGGAMLVTGGHAFSWHWRHKRLPLRSAAVGLAVLGLSLLMPRTVKQALNGNWLPVAYFMLLFQGITSFELRSRGGLYASIGISGVILFLTSYQALDNTFVVFLAGFTTLFLAFLAIASLADQAWGADIKWFRSRSAFAWLWSGIFIVLLAVSAAVFLVLPADFGEPGREAVASVLPMRASSTAPVAGPSALEEVLASALPVTPAGGDQVEGSGSGLPTSAQGQDLAAQAAGAAPGPGQDAAASGGAPANSGALASPLPGPEMARGGSDPVVMQVRSPVLSYWRGQAFESFEGGQWRARGFSGLAPHGAYDLGGPNGLAAHGLAGRPLYPQTYFVRQGQADGLFTGYAPLRASVVSEGQGGTTYRVLSGLPDYSLDALRNAAPSSRLEYIYHQVPAGATVTHALAQRITEGAFTDLERVRRIVTYLDRNYEFDHEARDQLELTAPPELFLRQQRPGTSMDFATATVLLARAAGVPARLVTGYLPGEFDPLSGTYVVQESDRHAWAEVFLNGAGWVPFDSSPRPEAAALGRRGVHQSPQLGGLFRRRYGDEVFRAVQSSPQRLSQLLDGGPRQGLIAALGVASSLALLGFGVLLALRLRSAFRRSGRKARYTLLQGDARRRVLAIYRRAERLLRRSGLGVRSPSQTLQEYTAPAEAGLDSYSDDLVWLRQAAWAAAYDPRPCDPALAVEARRRLRRLGHTLRQLRRA